MKTTTEVPTSTINAANTNETEDKGFLDYLPVDLLKKVHKTLKSQPPTLIGKIRFLKAFERTLVEEIGKNRNYLTIINLEFANSHFKHL